MFKVNEYLEIVKEYDEESVYVVESCAEYCVELNGYYVVLKKEKLPELLKFVENNLQNPTYVYTLLNKNTVKGMDLLKNMLKISDYTVEFIKHYDGVQGVLDLFKPERVEEVDKPEPLAFSTPVVNDTADTVVYDETTPGILSNDTPKVLDEQDAGWEASVKEDEVPAVITNEDTQPMSVADVVEQDVVPISTVEDNGDEDIKTETTITESYNQVMNEENNVPALLNPEMGELMLMIRAMAAKMGVTDEEQQEVMNDDDILAAKMYLNEMAAVTVRDAVIAVLDSANTQEERAAVTTFFSMFISYMKGV